MSTLSEFIPYTIAQNAVSLIATDDEAGLARISEELKGSGFSSLESQTMLANGGKHFLVLTNENAKDSYDLAMQYGTGQISSFNETIHAPEWVTPEYKGSALIIVATKELIELLEANGLPFRKVTGLTTQL